MLHRILLVGIQCNYFVVGLRFFVEDINFAFCLFVFVVVIVFFNGV